MLEANETISAAFGLSADSATAASPTTQLPAAATKLMQSLATIEKQLMELNPAFH